jgi:membrane protease YdiL (CAAX protease family)
MGRIGPYFIVFLIAPLVFFFIYILTWKLGLSGFDPTMNQLAKQGGAEITPENIKIILALSIFLGPLFNLIFGLGEEIGWRGFLLPRLMPLGKTKAYIILGIIWGLWHSPIIYAGFNYPGYPMGGIAMMCALTIAFGLFLNEMTLHYKSSILAGFIHGAINAQGFGIWAWMFPDANPMLGGGTGLVAVVVWLITGFATMKILMRLKQAKTP